MVVRSFTELREMLEDEHTRLKHNLQDDRSWTNDHMGYGNHMADDATEAFEQAKELSVRTRLEEMLLDVEEALTKFELGTYGVCEACSSKIDWARLEAKPEARLCIKCKQRIDFGR
jgi:DnaK suppressor protein